MANAAKQVGNVSAGPWWHYFRRQKIARMVRDQLSMGPLRAIACGFTDARFVEMVVAKYQSARLGIADAWRNWWPIDTRRCTSISRPPSG